MLFEKMLKLPYLLAYRPRVYCKFSIFKTGMRPICQCGLYADEKRQNLKKLWFEKRAVSVLLHSRESAAASDARVDSAQLGYFRRT
jgi:hypothetical protein